MCIIKICFSKPIRSRLLLSQFGDRIVTACECESLSPYRIAIQTRKKKRSSLTNDAKVCCKSLCTVAKLGYEIRFNSWISKGMLRFSRFISSPVRLLVRGIQFSEGCTCSVLAYYSVHIIISALDIQRIIILRSITVHSFVFNRLL